LSGGAVILAPAIEGEQGDDADTVEGYIHSESGGFEGLGYSGRYATDYRALRDEPEMAREETWTENSEGDES